MDENKLYKVIETLNNENKELLNSREYILGKRVIMFLDSIKRFNVKLILNKYKKSKIQKIESKKYIFKNECAHYNYNIEDNIIKSKIVVYTCITGNYDDIVEPVIKEKNVDYILFTDSKKLQKNNWKIKVIPDEIKKLDNAILINRYMKMHPHEFFLDYDYAIYIDGNVQLMSKVSDLIPLTNNKLGIAVHEHSKRDCIYDEANACFLYKKGNKEKILDQINFYRNEKFPKNFGLFECGIIVFDLKNKNSKVLMENWWSDFLKHSSYRDQLSFSYILWKMKYKKDDVGIIGNNVYKNPKVKIIDHK